MPNNAVTMNSRPLFCEPFYGMSFWEEFENFAGKPVKELSSKEKIRLLRRFTREGEQERVLDDIARQSRDPFGHNRQSVHEKIDIEILSGFADCDEIENEERVNRHFHRPFQHSEDVADSYGFHHEEGCTCIDDNQCQICCTTRDLLGVRKESFKIIDRRPRIVSGVHIGEELTVQMLLGLAEDLGFI